MSALILMIHRSNVACKNQNEKYQIHSPQSPTLTSENSRNKILIIFLLPHKNYFAKGNVFGIKWYEESNFHFCTTQMTSNKQKRRKLQFRNKNRKNRKSPEKQNKKNTEEKQRNRRHKKTTTIGQPEGTIKEIECIDNISWWISKTRRHHFNGNYITMIVQINLYQGKKSDHFKLILVFTTFPELRNSRCCKSGMGSSVARAVNERHMMSTAFPLTKIRQYQDYQDQIFHNINTCLCRQAFPVYKTHDNL